MRTWRAPSEAMGNASRTLPRSYPPSSAASARRKRVAQPCWSSSRRRRSRPPITEFPGSGFRVPGAGTPKKRGTRNSEPGTDSQTAALTRDHARSFWLASTLAAAAIALIPLWYHVVLVESGVQGIIAVFSEVGVYPSDGCLAVLGLMAIAHPVTLDSRSRWLGVGLSLLGAVALLSARQSRDQVLTSGLSGQLAILALAWFGSRSLQVSRIVLVAALVASAVVQSALAAGQFLFQQPLVAPELQLPWLPGDVSEGGTPVILNSAGERLLRGFGTFPHPNVLGGYLAMALVCLPVLGVRWPRRAAALWWLLGAAISIGLLASFSRAGWLAAVVGLSVSCWPVVRQRHARWWIAPIAAVAVLSP